MSQRKRIPTPLEWQALQRLVALHYEATSALANMIGEFLPVSWIDKLTLVTQKIPVRMLLEDIAIATRYEGARDLFSQQGTEHAMADDYLLRMLRDKRSTLPDGSVQEAEPAPGTHLEMLITRLISRAMKAAKAL